MNIRITPKALSGTVRAISSKSHAHRLLLATAISELQQLQAYKNAGFKTKRYIVTPILMACSNTCTVAFFQTRRIAEKYPLQAEESAIKGSVIAKRRREEIVRASFNQNRPIGSAKEKSKTEASDPKQIA